MSVSIIYDAAGGGHVDVSFPLDPYKVLEVPHSASRQDIKNAFANNIRQLSRQKRAMVSIASHILTSTTGRYKRAKDGTFSYVPTSNPSPFILTKSSAMAIHFGNHFMLAATGHTERLARRIGEDKSIVTEEDEHKRTLLYIACKSGFYDTSKLLLTKGASVNKTQIDGSTPLHVAAFYGHELVVGLLLEHGAATNIKNKWGSTALDESRTEDIKSLIKGASEDRISSLAAQLTEKSRITNVRLVEYKDKVIGKELVRDSKSLDESTRAQWDDITKTWEPVWHGTRYENVQPILEKGLLPSGSSGINPPDNHYALNEKHFGIQNWAAAIFVSPSIKYAGHACYSERVVSKPESTQWCVLVKALCKPKSYKSYDPTVYKYDPIDGEPDKPEYRVPVSDKDRDVIFRVESSRSVVVQSVVFVRLRFLENEEIDFEEATKIFA